MKIAIEDDEWVSRTDASTAVRRLHGLKFGPDKIPVEWYEHRTIGNGKRRRVILVLFSSFRAAVFRWCDQRPAPVRKAKGTCDCARMLADMEAKMNAMQKEIKTLRESQGVLYP